MSRLTYIGSEDDERVVVVSVSSQSLNDATHCVIHGGQHRTEHTPTAVCDVRVQRLVTLWNLNTKTIEEDI